MVDAIGIEITSHLVETIFPPLIVVFGHLMPVVDRESPYLTCLGEIVGWGTCTSVAIEEFGMFPHVGTVSVDADRHVTFQCYSLGVDILHRFGELLVQMKK